MRSYVSHGQRYGPRRTTASRALTILLTALLMAPAVALGQPASPSPVSGDGVESLVTATLGSPLPDPVFLGLIRLVVPAGASVPGGRLAGTRIIIVERGELTVQLGTSGAVTGELGGAGNGSDEEMRLGADDSVLVPPETDHAIQNRAGTPATVLDLVMLPAPPPTLAPVTTDSGIVFQPLLFGEFASTPAPDAVLTLDRLTFPAASGYLSDPVAGPTLVYVASGDIVLSPRAGEVAFRRAAAPIPGSVPGPLEPSLPGEFVALGAGSAIHLQQGTDAAIRSRGDRTAIIVVLAISPGN